MKRTIHLLILLVLCSTNVLMAQNRQHHKMNREEFCKRQQEFLTQTVDLTSDEADKFFPLYYELQRKKNALNKEAWQKLHRGQHENLTESEYSKIVDDVIKARIAADELEYEYIQKYKKFLSAEKIFKLQHAEMLFHRRLLNKARNMKAKCKSPAERQK